MGLSYVQAENKMKIKNKRTVDTHSLMWFLPVHDQFRT